MADLPDKHKRKSRYTAERNMPGAFEGETVTRRTFMTGGALAYGGIATAMFGLPALGFALGRSRRRGAEELRHQAHVLGLAG